MRLPLGAKILGSYGIIVFLALGITVGAGQRFTQSQYNEFAAQRDRSRARAMAPFLDQLILEAVNAEKDDPQSEFPLPGPHVFTQAIQNDELLSTNQSGHHRHMNPPPRRSRRQDDFFDRMLITDAEGRVLYNTMGNRIKQYPDRDDQPGGVEIYSNQEVVGYLYIGQMFPSPPRSDEEYFFQNVGLKTLTFTALIFLIVIILGIVLTRHIVIPVKSINAAARQVKEGILNVRVPDRRQDEMGDLARGFNAMTASLEAADRQRKQLIADSAHELRTPVSIIRTRIEMMEEGVYPMDTDGLTALASETDHLIRLIEELKTLATLESPDFSMKLEKVNLAELIKDSVNSSQPIIAQSGFQVETSISDSIPVISGNAEKLRRMIKNLLSNALCYAQKKIVISVNSGPANRIEILVEDDGPGIPDEMKERVFERFYRLDSSRSRDSGGSGLGLAICREIIKAHSGEISVHTSENLGGAAFLVVIPNQSESPTASNKRA